MGIYRKTREQAGREERPGIGGCRAVSENVGGFYKSVRELELPPKPHSSASPEKKREHTRTCTELKFQCIQKADMVYTVLYHKWINDHRD